MLDIVFEIKNQNILNIDNSKEVKTSAKIIKVRLQAQIQTNKQRHTRRNYDANKQTTVI